MKVAWAVVWAAAWVAWAAAAPTKNSASPSSFLNSHRPVRRVQRDTDDGSEESESPSKIAQAEVIPIGSLSPSLQHKRHTVDSNFATGSLAPASGVGLGFPSTQSFSNPASVVPTGVPLDLNPRDPAYRVALASPNPSLSAPDFFVQELEALEDLIQAGSLTSGASVSIDGPRNYQGSGGGVGGQVASSPVGVPLQVTEIGGLQGDFADSQIVAGDILNLNAGDFQGLQGTSLGAGGALQDDLATFVGTDLLGSTGELQGVAEGFGGSFLGSDGLEGLQLGSTGFGGLQGDSYGIALPLGSTGGLQGGSAGFEGVSLPLDNTGGLQGGSAGFEGVSLPLGNTGGLQDGSGGFEGVSLPLGNTGGLQGGSAGFEGVPLPLGNTGELQGGSAGFEGVSLPLGNTGGLQGGSGGFEGVPLPLGNTGELQGGSGGFEGVPLPLGNTGELQGGSVGFEGVSLPLGNTGGLQDGSGGLDGLQTGSYGVSLPLGDTEGYVGGSGGLDTLQGGSYGVSLPLGNSGDLQLGGVSLSDLQTHSGVDTANYAPGEFNGVALQSAGSSGPSVVVTSTTEPNLSTGVLLGASGVSDVHLADFDNVGVPLAEAVEINHLSEDPTEVPENFTASSFDPASLDSLGQLLTDNVDEIEDPSQSLGSFLMNINGRNGMIVLPTSELEALQNGELSVTGAANASLHTNFSLSEELNDDGLLDIDFDLLTGGANDLEVAPSLATILATTLSGNTSTIDLLASASAPTASTHTTTPTTTTTTTTEGPPRLGEILPTLLSAKGEFFGTLLGGLTDIAETIYRAITETDWTASPATHSYS
ncbi:PE-PGRS family protein PE_PGRS16-like [Scylla paramamosain]|uniref:PE-PGRS family protein PE_PGRS16-like n=1 Tax=Scylla paramamosain TaxID=85552 RepID=UPI003082F9EB